MPLAVLPLLTATAQMATLEIDLEQVRNSRGVIQACITRDRAHFPDCKRDPAARKQTVAATTRQVLFTGLVPATYAVALFHDENANGKLDTVLGIPREGFGFSRNPVVRFSAPRFEQVSMEIRAGFTRIRVRLQYLL